MVSEPKNESSMPPSDSVHRGYAPTISGLARWRNAGAAPRFNPGETPTGRNPGASAGVMHVMDAEPAREATGATVPN